MVATIIISALAVLIGVGCILYRMRLARGPYAGASWEYPRLCRACAEPVVDGEPPAWLAQMITTPRVGDDGKAWVRVALPGLLDGRAEAVVLGHHTYSTAVVRVTGVRVPDDLASGSWVAAWMALARGGSQVRKVATVRPRPGIRHGLTIWQHTARGPMREPSEASQRALQAAFYRCSWLGLHAIEVHDGAVCLAFSGLGSMRVAPRHVAAICAALDIDTECDRSTGTPSHSG